MEDATKGESPVEDTPAPKQAKEEVSKTAVDPALASIYEKYDAIKAAREEAEATPAEEVKPETPPKEEASEPEEKPKAEPVREPEVEELTLEQAKEKAKNLRIKIKLDGKDEVLTGDTLLARAALEEGRERALQRKSQELAREREVFERERAAVYQPSQPPYNPPIPEAGQGKPLQYWNEDEVAQKYNELVTESPYHANKFLKDAEASRQSAKSERMNRSEQEYFEEYPEREAPLKKFFSDPKSFSDPQIAATLKREDAKYTLDVAYVKVEAKRLTAERDAFNAARESEFADEQKKIELKKKGSVIRSASKPDAIPKEEYKPKTPSEVIREMQESQRAIRGVKN